VSLNFKYNNRIIIGTEACIFFSKKRKEIRTSLIHTISKGKKYSNKIIALFVQLKMATAELALLWFCINWFFWNFSSILIEIRHCFQSPSPNILHRTISSKIHSFHMIFTLIFFLSSFKSFSLAKVIPCIFWLFFTHLFNDYIKLLRLFCKFVFFSFFKRVILYQTVQSKLTKTGFFWASSDNTGNPHCTQRAIMS